MGALCSTLSLELQCTHLHLGYLGHLPPAAGAGGIRRHQAAHHGGSISTAPSWRALFSSSSVSCIGDGAFLTLRMLFAGLMLAILGLSLQGSAVAPELAASATNSSAFVDTGGNCLRYWPIFLTNWTLLVAIVYLCLASYTTWRAQSTPDVNDTALVPGFARATWLLQGLALPGCFFVTVLFWGLVFDGTLHNSTVFTHGVNMVLVSADVALSRQPLMLLHGVYFLVYCALYLLWSLIYHAVGGVNCSGKRYIYGSLDWHYPASTLRLVVLVLVVAVPTVNCLCWAMCGLRPKQAAHTANPPGDEVNHALSPRDSFELEDPAAAAQPILSERQAAKE